MSPDTKQMTNKQVVAEIKKRLTEAGVFVEVYNSISTNSVYMCFDKGVLKTARVGDHKGKPKYHYTYEIGSHIKEYSELKGEFLGNTFTRFKFPLDDIEGLVTEVLIRRSNLRAKYGRENYSSLKSTTKFPGRK